MTPLTTRFDETTTPPVLHIAGELDIATADQLEEALATALDGGRSVVLDCADLTFIDAAGMRVILVAAEGLNGSGPLTVVNGERVSRLLALVGLAGLPSIDLQQEGAVNG